MPQESHRPGRPKTAFSVGQHPSLLVRVRLLPLRQAPNQPQNQSATSKIEVWNMVHSDSVSPRTRSKLCQKRELKQAFLAGPFGSDRLPPPLSEPTQHQGVIGWSSVPLFTQVSRKQSFKTKDMTTIKVNLRSKASRSQVHIWTRLFNSCQGPACCPSIVFAWCPCDGAGSRVSAVVAHLPSLVLCPPCGD